MCPARSAASFVANALAGAAGFGVVGWVFGLSPSYLHEQLHIHITQPVVAGLFAALVVLTNGVTQLVLRRHHSARAMQLALTGLVTGMGLMALSTVFDSLPVAIVGGVIAGAGAGVSQMNALATIQRIAPEHARGGVTSAYFTICYVAMSLPVLAAGVAADRLGLGVVTAWYFVGVVLLAGFAFGRIRAEAVEPADATARTYAPGDAATAA